MDHLESLLHDALKNNIGSGMAAAFGSLTDLLEKNSYQSLYLGKHSHEKGASPVNEQSFFDLASLTKIIATTLLFMQKTERNEVDLLHKLPISKSEVTLKQFLSHRSGLPAWHPFYESLRQQLGTTLLYRSRAEREQLVFNLLETIQPIALPDEMRLYSDLGFLVLLKFLGKSYLDEIRGLWSLNPKLKFHFNEIKGAAPVTLTAPRERYVATEACPWRGLLQGEVHDDNTWAMGGVSTHAGAFGRLVDVVEWIRWILSNECIQLKTVRKFATEGIGFDRPSPDGMGSTGHRFHLDSFGHLGFTGTALWIDPVRDRFGVLLTNRVHPSRSDNRIRELRRAFFSSL